MFCTNPECPDLQSTGRPGEYVDGVDRCPICGAWLVERPDDGNPSEPLGPGAGPEEPSTCRGAGPPCGEDAGALEPVFVTDDPTEVPIVRSLLESAGIEVLVEGANEWDALRGGLTPFRFSRMGPRIVFSVHRDQAEEARAVLEAIDEGGEEWSNPTCPPTGCGGGCGPR